MSLPCTVLRTSLCLFLAIWLSSGQAQPFDTEGFYKHLKDENLLMEQVAFGNRLIQHNSATREQKDSLLLDLSASYLKLGLRDSCIFNLTRISEEPKFPEAKKQLLLSSLVLTGQYGVAVQDLRSLNSLAFSTDLNTSLVILLRQEFKTDTFQKYVSPFALDLKNRYVHAPRHSPFVAGTLSAVLPGAGKWYVGYKRQALTAFIANALFAAQAIESYSKAGVESPQFIITAGLFSIFYSGNIWGSVQAAKKKKRDHLKQIDHEILDHYTTEFTRLSR